MAAVVVVSDQLVLLSLQAALRGGAAPSEALAAVGDGSLEAAARQARLGRSLAEIAAEAPTGERGADILLRCLALADRVGRGAAVAVDQALAALRDERRLAQILQVRTAQARGTAKVLAAIPATAWGVLVLSDPSTLAFYRTGLGIVSAVASVCLAWLSWRCMRRLVAAAQRTAQATDLLAAPPGPPWRRRRDAGPSGGGAETVLLVAVALEAGMGPLTAVDEVAELAPAAAQSVLRAAAARMAAGQTAREAFAETPLAPLGAVITATHRWGAPAAPALHDLAEQLRDDRRTAAEIAGERLQLALVFPTTLLTLPAFVLGVVPPLLWTTLHA